MPTKINTKTVCVKDMGCAAFLFCQRFEFLGLKPENKYQLFMFKGDSIVDHLNSYWSGQGQVSALAYNQALRTLKDRLFSCR